MTEINLAPALDVARKRLSDEISQHRPPRIAPLDISPWVAMSMLQKAIRRGQLPPALRATATLLMSSSSNLWMRCAGIAFEDIGVADVGTISLVVAAIAGKRFRSQLGGEWHVASFIVSRMVQANKCRAADDLLMAAELHPDCAQARREDVRRSTSELLGKGLSGEKLPARAVALWYAVGTGWRPRHLLIRRGDPVAVFSALGRLPGNEVMAQLAAEGFRKGTGALCPLVALLHPIALEETNRVEDDLIPPETINRGVPSWALDVYSREGRHAFQIFLRGSSDTARWVRAQVRPGRQIAFLGGIVFRVEGGLVLRRRRWPTADHLRELVDLGSHGATCGDVSEVLELMRRDIPRLNEARSHDR